MIPFAPSPREVLSGAMSGSHASTLSPSETLTDSVFSILHDLKNPLWGIRLSSQLLSSSETIELNVHEVAEDIRTSCDQIFSLLHNLQELYTLNATGKQIPLEDVDMLGIVGMCVERHKPLAEHKSVNVHVSLPTNSCFVHTNPTYLSRIVCNLISNAVKFTPTGKSVQVEVALDAETNVVLCRISDEGPGFTDQDLAVLYEKFAYRSAVPTNGELSSRLGLAIVKVLADSLGIAIALETQLTLGSTFNLAIPIGTSQEQLT